MDNNGQPGCFSEADPKDVQLQSVIFVAAKIWNARLSMCKMAAAVLRHVKLQRCIKGPEMRLKHTTTSERSEKKAQRKVDRRSEWLISSDAEKSPWTYCISLYAETVLEPRAKAWKAHVTATLNHSETFISTRESSQTGSPAREPVGDNSVTPSSRSASRVSVHLSLTFTVSVQVKRNNPSISSLLVTED